MPKIMKIAAIREAFADEWFSLREPPSLGAGQDCEFLVDTGAAYTALSKAVVALLGMTSAPQRTAAIIPVHSGIIRVPVVTITALRIGEFRIANVMAIVLEFPPALKLDGMLGMDVLKRFRVTLEIDTGTLVLRQIDQPTPTTRGLGRT